MSIDLAGKEPPNRLTELARLAVAVAHEEIGSGESGGNNTGPDVIRYRGGIGGTGSWCAAFVQWCFEEAARRLGLELPWDRTHGAKALTKRIARAGRVLDWRRGEQPRRGDVICWNRGVLPWQGHVGFVAENNDRAGYLVTIEGNRGEVPAMVDGFYYPHRLWIRDLYMVARLE